MKRQAYLEKLAGEHRQFGFKNLIYVDETGFDSSTHRPSGWAQKGLKILGEVTGKRTRRTNLLMAQRHGRKGERKEWLAPMLFQGSCNSELFETWVRDCLMKELREPTIVVMDNASFHNHKRVQDILAKDYHYLIPLPPYSPDFNPIEQTFGAMKKRRQGMPQETNIENLILSYY